MVDNKYIWLYNFKTMKKQTFTFVVEPVKHRNHIALFAENSPFKPKQVQRKDLYRRKPKHVARSIQD